MSFLLPLLSAESLAKRNWEVCSLKDTGKDHFGSDQSDCRMAGSLLNPSRSVRVSEI